MAGSSIQFYGSENVLAAYDARGIDTWGLFSGKQFINAGHDRESLQAFLKMLEPGGSAAAYTLKVYRDVEDLDELTDKTECNGSFNFKLFAPMAEASLPINRLPAAIHGSRYVNPAYDRLQGALEAEAIEAIDRKLNGTPAEEEKEDWGDILIGLIKKPDELVKVINAIGGLLRPGAEPAAAFAPLAGPAIAAHRVGSVPAAAAPALGSVMNDEQKLQRLAAVLDRLEKADPEILIHLEQLADIAEKEPKKYKMALSLL